MLYTDGLNTLFAFGGIYAATLFNMKFSEIILFGIALNISAGIGSVIFAFFDDKFGPRIIIFWKHWIIFIVVSFYSWINITC